MIHVSRVGMALPISRVNEMLIGIYSSLALAMEKLSSPHLETESCTTGDSRAERVTL